MIGVREAGKGSCLEGVKALKVSQSELGVNYWKREVPRGQGLAMENHIPPKAPGEKI